MPELFEINSIGEIERAPLSNRKEIVNDMSKKTINKAADLFCGAGGLSVGVEQSKKVKVVIAVNHWIRAIETHSANMPDVTHFCQDVDTVNPVEMIKRGVNTLLASPECTNHCTAKGGRPYNEQSRSTAWHVLKFADAIRPDHVIVENVKEFMYWGPLFDFRSLTDSTIDWKKEKKGMTKARLKKELKDWESEKDLFGHDVRKLNTKKYKVLGRPIYQKRGEVFRAWCNSLKAMGFTVDYKMLNAADYGAATSRSRLFIVASRVKNVIPWPKPTVLEKDWKPARDIIDWSLPSVSIFDRAAHGKRPLSENTLKRIEAGIRKFWGDGFEPFIVTMYGQSTAHSVDAPLGTVTSQNKHALIEPFLIKYHGGRPRVHSIDEPIRTIDTSNRFGLVTPFLIKLYGTGKANSVEKPLGTVTAGGNKFAIASPFLVKYYGTGKANSVDKPVDTITTKDRFGLVEPCAQIEDGMYQLDLTLRMLEPHELAAAMGFPEDYKIYGSKADKVRQIGNAVSPNVAKALATAIM